MGEFTITGDTLIVQLSDAANEYVIADAIRIEPVPAGLAALLTNIASASLGENSGDADPLPPVQPQERGPLQAAKSVLAAGDAWGGASGPIASGALDQPAHVARERLWTSLAPESVDKDHRLTDVAQQLAGAIGSSAATLDPWLGPGEQRRSGSSDLDRLFAELDLHDLSVL
jgi:hypothetical protein